MLARFERSIQHHEDQYAQSGFAEHAESIAAIADELLVPPNLTGRILIIGCAGMHEASLISEDVFAQPIQLLPDITQVVGIDDFLTLANQEDYAPSKAIQFFDGTNQYRFIERYWDKKSFDYIFMLRIEYFNRQVKEGLLDAINTLLAPGGFFIASGSIHALPQIQNHKTLTLIRNKQINDKYADFYFFSGNHMGFVLTKK